MMPMYMNSSQQGQMRPQGNYHNQGFETNNPHHHMTTMDAPCGYWPTPPQSPSPCYGSCIHGNFPAYQGYWPPCYPAQAPCHHPCCMNHSGFHPHAPPCYSHQPFPVSYQPVHESEKDVSGKHHCAKCPPLPRSNSGVVIEEHEPEIDKGDHGESVQSVRSGNFPYPIIWIPHENARIQESHDQPPEVQRSDPKSWNGCFPLDESALKSLMHNQQDRNKMQNGRTVEFPFDVSKLKSLFQGPKIEENGSGSHDRPPAVVKAPENMKIPKSDPRYVNGCFPFDESTMRSLLQNQEKKKSQNGKSVELPFDISKLKSLLQGQDGNKVQSQKNKEESEQLPYPVFWIPSHGKREDVGGSEGNLKSFPSDNSNEDQIGQYKGKEGNFESTALSDAKENHQGRQKMQNGTTVELPFDISKLKSLLQGRDVKVAQSQKSKEESVQHLYRATESLERTNNEGKEGLARTIPVKNHLQEPRNIPVKLSTENHLQTPTEQTKGVTKGEPVEKTKKVQSSSSSSPKASRLPPVCLRVDPLPKKKNGGSKSPLSSKKTESKTVHEACNIKSVESKASSTKESTEKSVKKTFTEEEAARIIQSRYRGYDVRRWEPLKKLKEIATVREQMYDVEKRVQALEASSNDKHIEEKEIIVLEETVMNLVLKLDSVQGLHHSIREHRKSLARELSDIEEKLDSLKEENKTVSDSKDVEKVLLPQNPSSEAQLAAEAQEEGPGSGTETGKSEVVAISSVPEDVGEVETAEVEEVVPIDPVSADGNGVTVRNSGEDKVMVENLEDPLSELPQVVEIDTGVSETDDEAGSEVVSKEETTNIETCESQDLHETVTMESETARQEGTSIKKTSEPQEETEVVEEETKKLIEENQRFKEMVETLVKAGREQHEVISKLTGRVKSLEKKLSQKKKKRSTQIGGRRTTNREKQVTEPMSVSSSSTDAVI